MPNAALLLSRQPKHPHGHLLWVRQTVAAVRSVGERGYTVLTSVGMNTWELILAVARLEGVRVKIIADSSTPENPAAAAAEIRRLFELDAETEVSFIGSARPQHRSGLRQRDCAIISEADLLVPISVRPGGQMATLIIEAEALGKAVDRTFYIGYERRAVPLAYSVPRQSQVHQATGLDNEYLIHWTRAASHRWPDERPLDYFRAIIESDRYPRTAYHTLQHILTTRRLIASRRHMPRNTATVAFTALPIADVLPLMRWRAKYAEMAFEPYGIGVHRDLAPTAGLFPVQYYDPELAFPDCSTEPWLTQSIGMKTDWRQEREYRHKGDMNLRAIPDDALVAFCPSPNEATALFSAAGIRTIALFG